MTILAIETSSNLCGVSLSNDDKLIDKIEHNTGLTHSETLMPLVKELLENNNFTIKDINAFVCDVGPGSFTGIRIGVATCLAFIDTSVNAKFTGVCSLEALAYNCKNDGYICSVLDCRNDNCYFALYSLNEGKYNEIIAPKATSIIEMIDIIKDYNNSNITFVGDGAVLFKNLIQENFESSTFLDDDLNSISIKNVAIAGFNRLKNNSILDMLPMYLKKPQAELLNNKK